MPFSLAAFPHNLNSIFKLLSRDAAFLLLFIVADFFPAPALALLASVTRACSEIIFTFSIHLFYSSTLLACLPTSLLACCKESCWIRWSISYVISLVTSSHMIASRDWNNKEIHLLKLIREVKMISSFICIRWSSLSIKMNDFKSRTDKSYL